jgi:hypothetical protein
VRAVSDCDGTKKELKGGGLIDRRWGGTTAPWVPRMLAMLGPQYIAVKNYILTIVKVSFSLEIARDPRGIRAGLTVIGSIYSSPIFACDSRSIAGTIGVSNVRFSSRRFRAASPRRPHCHLPPLSRWCADGLALTVT